MSEVKLDPAANQREPACPLASVKMKLSLRDAAYVNDRQVLESFRAMRLISRETSSRLQNFSLLLRLPKLRTTCSET